MPPERHRHGVGEKETAKCSTCRLAAAAATLSEYESAVLDWYLQEINPFADKHGIVADSFRELGLKGPARGTFYKAVNMIEKALTESPKERGE